MYKIPLFFYQNFMQMIKNRYDKAVIPIFRI